MPPARAAPRTGQRVPGKRRAGLQAGHVDDRRRQVPQADRLVDDLLRRAPPGRDDQERDVQLGLVEARPVAEDAGMLAETLAVVRGDDQPGLLEDPAPVQLVDQLPELLIEVRDAIVVGVGGECDALGRERRLVELPPVLDQDALIVVASARPRSGGAVPAAADRDNGRRSSSGRRRTAAPAAGAATASRGARD